MNHLKNIGALKADYEAGINSKVDIANKHGISAVTLWRYASRGKWSYGKMREEVLESLSQAAIERLSKLTESVIEEHVLLLSDIRRKMIALNDPKEVKHYSSQVDALLKCIKGERTALGLPNHIVGMSTFGSVVEAV